MGNRDNGKMSRRPRLKGLERRSNACRRNNLRRKSDDSKVPAAGVRAVSAADRMDIAGQNTLERPGRESSRGIEQVNQAIVRLDQAVRQNAFLLQEVAAVAESLEQRSQRLERILERLHIQGSVTETAPPPVKTTRRDLRSASRVRRRVLGTGAGD